MREAISEGQGERLRWMIHEATRSLACLDAERLEELANCCQLLTRQSEPDRNALPWKDAELAKADLAVLGRLLEATQQNLRVLRHCSVDSRTSGDYGRTIVPAWTQVEESSGDH